jgi:hypothetical protein
MGAKIDLLFGRSGGFDYFCNPGEEICLGTAL